MRAKIFSVAAGLLSLAHPVARDPVPRVESIKIVDIVPDIVKKIARAEGFFTAGTLPKLLNNPCSLVYTGQKFASRGSPYNDGYYARFATASVGWSRCEIDVRHKLARGISLGTAWPYMR